MVDAALIRTLFVVAAIGTAALFLAGTRRARFVVAAIDGLASRRAAAVAVCAASAFVGSAVVAVVVRWPAPAVHDEFAYLLAADTFASGLLTNPTHPHWHHFETFYVLHEPSYASRFPPAQGAALALGLLAAGSPVVGLWISAAAMAGAVCWALYGFVSERWAFLAGMAVVCQIGVTSYWSQSFWGGAITAAAAALVVGATVRLLDGTRRRDAVLLGVGLVVLANARPFEGAAISIAAAAFLVGSMLRGGTTLRSLFPTVAIGLCGLVLMGAYNHAVVGSWWMPPYVEYERQYQQRPMFSFQEASAPKRYRHREFRVFFRASDKPKRGGRSSSDEAPGYYAKAGGDSRTEDEERGAGIPADEALTRNDLAEHLKELRSFFLGRVLVLPFLIGALVCWRIRPGRFAMAGLVLSGATLLLAEYFRVHYVAVAAPPLYVLVAMGFERLEGVRVRELPVGAALCAGLLCSTILATVPKALRIPDFYEMKGYSRFVEKRAAVRSRLDAESGKDLVLVRYSRFHNLHREWVYNRADIDGSDIVWARDMGEEANAGLLDYFSDRKVWTLHVDDRRDSPELELIRARADP